MSNEKIHSLLGLCARARKLVTGEELVIKEVRTGKVKLVIMANDASERTKKTVRNKCSFYEVPLQEFGERTALGQAIGKEARVIIGISDAGFAKSLKKLIAEHVSEFGGYVDGENSRP
ncbi:MAG: YlxQ family RNA-binding protein [Bacilli bacterium]